MKPLDSADAKMPLKIMAPESLQANIYTGTQSRDLVTLTFPRKNRYMVFWSLAL